MTASSPEIFFHVGLGKTASTYLQNRVFPHFRGIHYIPTRAYKSSLEQIKQGKHERYLVSREFDRQFEEEVRWFCGEHPDARLIIVFRRHDRWIDSQYRRHVKNGFYGSFREFIDIDTNLGMWDRAELNFMHKLRLIEKYSTQKPLILFHEDIKEDASGFIDRIAHFVGATYDPRRVSLKPMHTSYNENQLLAVRHFCKRFVKKRPEGRNNKLLHWLMYRPWWALFHLVMYGALLLPKGWFGAEEVVSKSDLERIREYMDADWQAVKAYAQTHSAL